MSTNKPYVNTAHGDGPCYLAFSRDGKVCYTGGEDGIVRLWQTSRGQEQEPETAIEACDTITCLAAGNKTWFSGSGDSDVREYHGAQTELKEHVTGAAGVPIRCVAVDPKGERIAVTSDELAVKVIEIEVATNIKLLAGHTAGVRRVTWHPSGSLLTTSGGDGRICVWDVTKDEPEEIQPIEGIIPAIRDTAAPEFYHDCSAVWHPSGDYFVVATRTHDIVTISKETWEKTSTFSDDSCTGATTALAMSPNGVYLATANNGKVFIWSTQTRRLLFSSKHPIEGTINQMAWSPTTNLLAWTTNTGTLYRWADTIPSTSPSPVKIVSSAATTRPVKRSTGLDLFATDIEDDGAAPAEKDADDVDMDDPFANDDWILDDVGDGMADTGEKSRGGFVKEMVSVTKAQPAFQSGSTPMDNKKRYLTYNMVGVIEVTDQDTHHIVNVEFHDRSARKAYHFTDHNKYHLGVLGERGALYASAPEGQHAAHVHYKPYGIWAAQGEWTYELDEDVHVLGIAAGGPPPTKSYRVLRDSDLQGNGNVVIATSENELTFLSGSGIERCSVGLNGDFLSMVAGPEWVFVVHRDGSTTMDGSQSLMCTLYDFEDLSVLQNCKLPLRKGLTLKWIGISDEGAPVIYDSAGVMYIMPRYRIPLRATWVRLLDTNKLERKQGKDESYWPVGVTKDTFMCLILKGRQEHPSFPRPLIQELPLRLPFRRKDPIEGPLEENVARESMMIQMVLDSLGDDLYTDELSRRELELDKDIIKLIQNACKSDRNPRVLELCRMLHHTSSFDMAIKVAIFYRQTGLQEKIEVLKLDREDGDRLVDARDKRRKWTSDHDAVPPPRLPPADANGSGGRRSQLLQDFAPPPAAHRPGLAKATPVAPPKKNENENEDGYGWVLRGRERNQENREGKRKGTSEDDAMVVDADSPDGAKRRRMDEEPTQTQTQADEDTTLPAPTKLKTNNPFAKKTQSGNPFGRQKSLQKNETFYDKVEDAETGNRPKKGSNGQPKPKAPPKPPAKTKQQTLFGFSKPAATKAKSSSPAVEMEAANVTAEASTVLVAGTPEPEESNGVDATTEETQVAEPPETDESQQTTIAENGNADDTQDDGDPLDWPESPPRSSSVVEPMAVEA